MSGILATVARADSLAPPVCNCKPPHPLSKMIFCRYCAAHGKPVMTVFFCTGCNPAQVNAHSHFGDRLPLSSEQFKKLYKDLKGEVKRTNQLVYVNSQQKKGKGVTGTVTVGSSGMTELLKEMNAAMKDNRPVYYNATLSGEITLEQLQEPGYREWLLKTQFWKSKDIKLRITKDIEKYWTDGQGGLQELQSFPVNFGESTIDLFSSMGSFDATMHNLSKEKALGDLFLRITTYFQDEDIKAGVEECRGISGEFDPSTYLMYIGQLKMWELHTNGARKMKEIFEGISIHRARTAKEKELLYYYSAMAEWECVGDPVASQSKQMVFYESRNRKHYKLVSPENYIRNIDMAMKMDERPLYYACRAIGRMALGRYKEAEEDFSRAEKMSYQNDAMRNNHNYNQLQLGRELDNKRIGTDLHERSTEYLINLAKHFRKTKLYPELKDCWQVLAMREDENVTFKIRLFEALLKIGDSEEAKMVLMEIRSKNALRNEDMVELERKIMLLKAREEEEYDHYSEAEEKYEEVARMGRPMATHWYNYAAFLFKHREHRQCNEKALRAVNQAIQLHPKPQFYQLKYLLLFVLGNIEGAHQIQDKFADPDNKFGTMREYVEENF